MTFNEGIIYLREVLGDYGELDENGVLIPGSQTYSDDRLAILLAISIKQVQTQLKMPAKCRIPVIMEPPYVPEDIDISDDFFEIVVLRALCALQKRNIEAQFGSESVSATLGPAKLSTGKAQWASMPKHVWESTSPCVEYNKLLLQWTVFDSRKLQAVYAVLPNVANVGTGTTRSRFGTTYPNGMIQ